MTDYRKYSSLYNSRGIFEVWHPYDWKDYTIPFYRNAVKKLVDDETTGAIMLYGSNGLGKSMLMNIAMKYELHKGKDVYVVDFRELVKQYIKSWRNEGIVEELMNCDCLAIDDIGKEFSNGGVSKELAVTTLDYVLRYRFQRQKTTWITTNMMLAEISEVYNGHIASLLKRNGTFLAFEGEDFGEGQYKKIMK